MRYGLPYQGSKNDIAQWVIDHLPPADVLIDAFAGGCAITHAALGSLSRFKRIVANDINDMPQLFLRAIQGEFSGEHRWISREDFFAQKENDPYIRICWSFGNGGQSYLYGDELVAYKKAYFFAAVHEDYSLLDGMGIHIPDKVKVKGHSMKEEERRVLLRRWASRNKEYIKQQTGIKQDRVDLLECLQRLERLRQLADLSHLSHKLAVTQGDYTTIPLPQGESYVIYCDPPYRDTDGGLYGAFDHERFYEWLRSMSVPVVVSEYSMPDDFVLIDEAKKIIRRSSNGTHGGAERLFCHESTIDKLPKTTLF